jgi:hypothetical protein
VRVLAELETALAERGFAAVADAVGYAHRAAGVDSVEPPAPPPAVEPPRMPVVAGAKPSWRLGGEEEW